jgi:hypothetical protein
VTLQFISFNPVAASFWISSLSQLLDFIILIDIAANFK